MCVWKAREDGLGGSDGRASPSGQLTSSLESLSTRSCLGVPTSFMILLSWSMSDTEG